MAAASASGVALTSLVNVPVRVTLVNDDIIEGVVFTYDVYSGVLALASNASAESEGSQAFAAGGKKRRLKVHLVTAANIKDLTVVTGNSAAVELPEVGEVPVRDIEERKQAAFRAAHERAMRIGVGVSDEAQALFEALSKTLPCRWVGNKIVVLDEVTIEAPYGVDNCKVSSNATYSLNRVKKVLQGEKSRLAQAGSGSS
ncbi:hypothetical protein EC988_000853 [Linderina pennispora]|nr:hypothetical protein EC988_000853 [Linderina pennispora]